MQDYGQPGGGAPPPMAPPPKKKGGKVLMIIGIILLIIGLIMMVMLWPMVGYISEDDFEKEQEDEKSGTYTVMFNIDSDEWKVIEAAKDLGMGEDLFEGIDGEGDYVQTVKIKDGVMTDASSAQKVPTMGGILGIVLLIVGIILMIVGIIKGKKAKAAAPPPPPMA